MKISHHQAHRYYRLFLTVTGLLLLVGVSLVAAPGLWWTTPLIVLLVAFQVCFPIHILNTEISLIHIITAGAGLIYGASSAGWAVALGVILGFVVRRYRLFGFSCNTSPHCTWLDAGSAAAIQVIALILALAPFEWLNGLAHRGETLSAWPEAMAPLLLFAILHSALTLFDFMLTFRPTPKDAAGAGLQSYQRDLVYLVMIEALPLPFLAIAVVAHPEIGGSTLVVLGAIPTILALVIYAFYQARSDLERRVQELSTLNHVSRVVRSTLDLENLLAVIHVQVTQLLKVNNFYVALYDVDEKRIWYPLAVKHGKRQKWAPRALMPDRLTDRVIHEGSPILLSPKTLEELERVGLPTSEENPHAWMGVPLITSDRTIGCLAVFSASRETQFTASDLNLLTILSGQVSVAIENALLYEQTQRRAAQLERLNQINSLISASLNPKEVLGQVCRSVADVGGGQYSAIFLLDADKGLVSLAHAYGLSEAFSKANQAIRATQKDRLRALKTGQPVLASRLSAVPIDLDYLSSLEAEKVAAFGEFPLITREGQIGFLAVYFNTPHVFQTAEVELLQSFASQAAMAVSNARLYAQVDSALSQRLNQLLILEAVGRELSAAINSERLFEMILDYAQTITNSAWGELSLYDPKLRTLTVKAGRGYPTNRSEFSVREGLAGRSVSTQGIVYLPDVRTDPDNIDMAGGLVLSHLSVPLIHEERVLGVLCLESERQDAYSSGDRAFISQLATQAAVAVVNAELYRETQRRLHEQSILYLVTTKLVSDPDLDSVQQTLVRSIDATLKPAAVGVYLWDDKAAVYQSIFQQQDDKSRGESHVCVLPERVYYADLDPYQTSLLKTGPLRISAEKGRELLANCIDCQALVFPLIASNQRLGMVLVHVPEKQVVQDQELRLLRTITSQVSISLHNALLFTDVARGRDRMAAVLNAVGEGILLLEGDGYIMLVNEFIQTLTGLRLGDLLNHRLSALPESALKTLGYTTAQSVAFVDQMGGQQAGVEKTTIKISDVKPEKVLERLSAPVLGQDGQAKGRIIVIRDVTEEHQMAQARELITGTLVHDLRSPVSAALSAIDVLDELIPIAARDELMDQALRVAHNSATRVLGLIEALLDIARMQSGRMELTLSPVNLHGLAEAILDEIRPQAKDYGIQLQNAVPTTLPPLDADQSKLTRILNNLVDNALKFTPAGGTITISADCQDAGQFAVRIADTGPGIAEEFRERVFERFTQIPGQSGRRRGSGLGLTFCRMAIEAHGGRIWIEGQPAPATGSIFTFTLPVSSQE